MRLIGKSKGSKWWQQIKDAAKETLSKEKTTNPLFATLYPWICKDEPGEGEVGTESHMQKTLANLCNLPLLQKKGEHVALRRWFSWLRAAQFHLRNWHGSLFFHYSTAMHLGLYRNAADTPWFSTTSQHRNIVEDSRGHDRRDEDAPLRAFHRPCEGGVDHLDYKPEGYHVHPGVATIRAIADRRWPSG